MAVDLEKILQTVKALPPEERQQVRQVLDETLPSTRASEHANEEAFQQQLVDVGLLREIKRHDVTQAPSQRRKRVDIQGTSLSETVIEERRSLPAYFFDTSALVNQYVNETGRRGWMI